MTEIEFKTVCEEFVSYLRTFVPRDTGNLAENGLRIEMPSPNECKIYIDEKIAPYMPFTNEKWLSPKWNGKKNPNEHWWNDSIELMMNILAENLGGELKKV